MRISIVISNETISTSRTFPVFINRPVRLYAKAGISTRPSHKHALVHIGYSKKSSGLGFHEPTVRPRERGGLQPVALKINGSGGNAPVLSPLSQLLGICLFVSLPLARENATAHEILKGPFLSQKGQWFYGFFYFLWIKPWKPEP